MDGPVLQPGFESFVGRRPIPQQHGMTVGELAMLFFHEWWVASRERWMDG